MKHLVLMRHGDAPYSSKGDAERRLSQLGKLQSHEAGIWIQGTDFKPDLVFYSPSERTLSTAKEVLSILGPIQTTPKEKLYQATKDQLLQVISEAPQDCNTLLVIGHNPGLTDLVRFLSHRLSHFIVPEACVLVFQFDIPDWGLILSEPSHFLMKR